MRNFSFVDIVEQNRPPKGYGSLKAAETVVQKGPARGKSLVIT
jgi:hypothetical protein